MESTPAGQGRESVEGLAEADLPAAPFALITIWVEQALHRCGERGGVPEPLDMALASVDERGAPNVRSVMLRLLTDEGPAFLTGLDSAKARELAANPAAALCLAWPALFRAIRMRGRVRELEREPIADHFRTLPWAARVAAWASAQSEPVPARRDLQASYAAAAARWPDTGSPADVPVPPRWGGYRMIPDEVEFWAGRRDRLHDRIVFSRVTAGSLAEPAAWRRHRLQP